MIAEKIREHVVELVHKHVKRGVVCTNVHQIYFTPDVMPLHDRDPTIFNFVFTIYLTGALFLVLSVKRDTAHVLDLLTGATGKVPRDGLVPYK